MFTTPLISASLESHPTSTRLTGYHRDLGFIDLEDKWRDRTKESHSFIAFIVSHSSSSGTALKPMMIERSKIIAERVNLIGDLPLADWMALKPRKNLVVLA